MKARVPATVAFLAAALASAVSGLSFIRHSGAQRMEKLAPVETVTVAPGTFTYRLPGEYLRDGRPVGDLTSAGYGHTLGASVGLGYVTRADGGAADAAWLEAGKFEVDFAGVRLKAKVGLKAPFDPAGVRIKL